MNKDDVDRNVNREAIPHWKQLLLSLLRKWLLVKPTANHNHILCVTKGENWGSWFPASEEAFICKPNTARTADVMDGE